MPRGAPCDSGHSTPDDRPPSPDRLTVFAWLGAIVVAAANPVAVRFAIFELDPFWGAALRLLPAGLIFAALVVILRLPPLSRGVLVGASIYGVVFFGGNFALTYWGLQDAPAATASIVNASVPLMAFGLAILHRLEVFRWHGLVGGLVALVGIAIVFGDQLSADVPVASLLALVGGAICAAEVPPLIKLIPRSHPIAINAVGMLVGGTLLAVLSAIVGERWSPPEQPNTLLALLFLILAGTVLVDFLYVFSIRRWSASAASYALVVIPPLTAAYAAVLLAEQISPVFVVGGAITLVGVWVGALSSGRR